ncbi:DUF4942 domain-containing protein [Tenacibaculum sp. 190524A02b]|uniref:DUF4942 domain-containing protein n=1 Tax=Tenacibaculum vairaonense TaxID=3137860 RepID=UPI0031FA7AB8
MFDKEFFPTPNELIEKLLEPFETKHLENDKYSRYLGKYNFKGSLLEPSAGKGNILEYIRENTKNNIDFYAIEKNEELKQILRSKSFDVIDSDFLNYNQGEYFDYIIMNPPFSNGADHLLKAIEISTNTKIACILNAETIKNPYSQKRKKLLSLIEKYGSYELIENGFKEAERKTNVEVAIIWLEINKEENKFDFDFISMDEIKVDFDFDIVNNSLAREDLIGNLNLRFEEVKKAYEEKLKADQKFDYYINAFLNGEGIGTKSDIIKKEGSPEQKFNYLTKTLKRFMWKSVINHLDIKKYLSSSVIKDFEIFISQQSKMAFTKNNVYSFFQFIMTNRKAIIEKAIVDVFEDLTSRGYTENRMFIETWKTNDAYKINRKVIAPAYVEYGKYMNSYDLKKYGDRFSLGYDWSKSILSDLDKVMMYLSGMNENQTTTIRQAIKEQINKIGTVKTGEPFDSNCQSTFFDIKFYKKGTIHIYFRDKKLWDEFNYRACDGKNWLPNNEKKTQQQQQQQQKPTKRKSKTAKKTKLKSELSNQLFELFAKEAV